VATPAAPAAAGDDALRAPGVRARAAQLSARHHVLPAIVLVVLVAVSGAMFLALRGVVHTQERRLLHERAEELAAYLQASTTRTGRTPSCSPRWPRHWPRTARSSRSRSAPAPRTGPSPRWAAPRTA
jgi:hypothetical protein